MIIQFGFLRQLSLAEIPAGDPGDSPDVAAFETAMASGIDLAEVDGTAIGVVPSPDIAAQKFDTSPIPTIAANARSISDVPVGAKTLLRDSDLVPGLSTLAAQVAPTIPQPDPGDDFAAGPNSQPSDPRASQADPLDMPPTLREPHLEQPTVSPARIAWPDSAWPAPARPAVNTPEIPISQNVLPTESGQKTGSPDPARSALIPTADIGPVATAGSPPAISRTEIGPPIAVPAKSLENAVQNNQIPGVDVLEKVAAPDTLVALPLTGNVTGAGGVFQADTIQFSSQSPPPTTSIQNIPAATYGLLGTPAPSDIKQNPPVPRQGFAARPTMLATEMLAPSVPAQVSLMPAEILATQPLAQTNPATAMPVQDSRVTDAPMPQPGEKTAPPVAPIGQAPALTDTTVTPLPPIPPGDAQIPFELTTGDLEQVFAVTDRFQQNGLPPADPIFATTLRPEQSLRVMQMIAEAARALPDRPVELALSPEELGRVRLTLQTSETSMNVLVTVERPETLELLRRNIDLLANELRDAGYDDVSFAFADQEPSAFDQQDGDTDTTGSPHDDAPNGAAIELQQQTAKVLALDNLSGLDIRL